ncbi:MAG: DUF1152 domain-containing protein [Deltaproteobacteria bacterium]|nr:DUF1152 domain-containing protein [Deltaproteobacteria bacterium]
MSSRVNPTFLKRLADPSIKTVYLCGCGGGFDFVHAMLLVPELRRLGKELVLGSYSFGYPQEIGGEAPVVFSRGEVMVKRVSAASTPDPYYGPEVHVASYLDARYPDRAPHWLYAYYARDFTVGVLRAFYQELVVRHRIDAVVLVDGGSDSLLAGDEAGLGDPIEDCVSVSAVAALEGVGCKVLLAAGLGCDRFNDVSDASSLRAIAELTARGAFLGALALEPEGEAFRFYRGCLEHIEARQPFRSVLAGAIIAATEGAFGRDAIPPRLASRVAQGEVYFWPLMGMLWAFDVEGVARRSLLSGWIREAETVADCYEAMYKGRALLARGVRPVEDLPRHREARPR